MLVTRHRQLEAVVRHQGRPLARCLLRRGRYMLGQDRKNEISIDEASISSRHARLTIVNETELYIEDSGSANGTLVDGQPAHGLTRVGLESRVELGECTLEFQRSGLPAAVYHHLPDGFLRAHRYNFGEATVQGSTSTIYEAHDTSLDRDVALKMMLPQSQASPAHVLRFIREAQISSQLQHPGIPPVYELSLDEQGQLFYTTRFVEGDSLAAILDAIAAGEPATTQRFSLAALLTVFQKVCDAVAFAHSRGVVHCALQPEGIMVGAFGEVFVVGWSFAKVIPALDAQTDSFVRHVHAPDGNMAPPLSPSSAPEQASGGEDIDARTDIYALGALLYRIVTLQRPISAPDEQALRSRILTGQIVWPSVLKRCPHWPAGKLPEHLAATAMKALSTVRAERHATVPHLQREVAAWQEGLVSIGEGGKLWKGAASFLGLF
jgi:tRNA A-37 threonylcarbamoyl transferase component Bud32